MDFVLNNTRALIDGGAAVRLGAASIVTAAAARSILPRLQSGKKDSLISPPLCPLWLLLLGLLDLPLVHSVNINAKQKLNFNV